MKLVTNIFILNVYAAFKQRGTAKYALPLRVWVLWKPKDLSVTPIAILFFIFGERCGSPSLVKASLEFLLNRIVCKRIETFCCFKKSVIFVLLNSMNYTCVTRCQSHTKTQEWQGSGSNMTLLWVYNDSTVTLIAQ